MNHNTGAFVQQQGGMNDHIINQSFFTEMDDPAIQGASGYVDPQQNFELDPQHIEGEFTNVAPKSSFKKRMLVASLCGVGFLSAVAGVLQMPQVKGFIDGSAVGPVAAASPVPAPIAQVPTSLGGLAEKPPASLMPPQEVAAPAAPVPATSAVVLPSAATQNPVPQVAAEAAPVAPIAPPHNSLAAPQPAPASLGAPQPVSAGLAPSALPSAPAVVAAPVVAAATTAAAPAVPPVLTTAAKSEATPQPTPIVKAAAPAASKQDVKQEAKPAAKQIASASSKTPPAAKKEASVGEEGGESVKPLVTFSAGQIGLRSLSPDTLVLVSSKTNAATRYRVGDSLPSGDVIQHLDSNAMTVVTNRKVIRIIN